MHGLKIKDFEENHRYGLRELYLICRKQTFSWLDTSSYQSEDFDAHTRDEHILVAEQDGVLVGFVSVYLSESFIHHLYIRADHQKKGIGKELLNAAVKMLVQPVRLKCLVRNKNAISFYKSCGWKFEMSGLDETGRYYLLINQ